MTKYQTVHKLVEESYKKSELSFAQWMWHNHVPVVAQNAEELSLRFGANLDIAVSGALLHDFGDAFVHRHSDEHEEISKIKATEILKQSGYSDEEITEVIESVIAPHSCKDGFLPETLEGKVLATADALAHLTTDFYVQFAWMHLPENKNYDEFIAWVQEKLDRDFHKKVFFNEVKSEVRTRYEALREIFC